MVLSLCTLLTILGLLGQSLGSPLRRADSNLPDGYLKPSFGQAKSNVYAQAKKSVTALTARDDYPGGWIGENANTVVAQWDRQQQTRDYYDFVKAQEEKWYTNPGGCYDYWQSPGVNCYNDDALWGGLSALEEYEAYGDQAFLDQSVSIWTYIRDHGYVDQSVIDKGYLEGVKYENNTVSATCKDQNGNDQSMIGGVYWQNGAPASNATEDQQVATNDYINSIATGLFADHSAQLCRVTSNRTYCDYAYSSAQWLDRFMVNSDGLLIDGLSGNSCKLSDPGSLYNYNSGRYLATYATLGHLDNNSTALDLASKTAIASMQTTKWNNDQGILIDGNGPVNESGDGVEFRAVLIRDLHRAHDYVTDEQLQTDITTFVNIQYYALTQLDSDSQTQPVNFGRNWSGTYEISGGVVQNTAIDVLNALVINPDSAYPDTTDTSVPIASA